MDTSEQWTPQQLANVLRADVRSEQTLAQTGPFLKQIDAHVSELIVPARKDIGMSAPSDNMQFIDRAYFYLLAKQPTAFPVPSVYLLPNRLWWGIAAWGNEEIMIELASFLRQLGVMDEDEEPVIQKGSFTSAWTTGSYLLLGHEMTADEIERQPDITPILQTVAEDMVDYYQRLAPHVEAIGAKLKAIEESVKPQAEELPEGLKPVHDLFTDLFPDPDYRRRCLNIFADAIEEAHEIGKSTWVITSPSDHAGFRLNVGKHQMLTFNAEEIGIRQDLDKVTQELQSELGDRVKGWVLGGNKAIPSSGWATAAPEHFADVWPRLHPPYLAHLRRSYHLAPSSLFKKSYRPEFVQYLRYTLGRSLPDPAYYTSPTSARRIVKIAPGRNARFWDDCLANGYICVGWDDVGDLQSFDSREAFEVRFRDCFAEEYNNHAPTIGQKAQEVWTLRELERGDVVIANKGKRRVLAVGTVVEPGYKWNTERDEFKHTVRVEWDTDDAQEIPTQSRWGFHTVLPVSDDLYRRILNKGPWDDAVDVVGRLSDWLAGNGFYFTPWQIATFFTALQTKGFVILSGISGTGKSKLAQHFARAFPQPVSRTPDDAITITVRPYMLKYNRFIIPKSALPLYDAPPAGETMEVTVRYEAGENLCRLTHETSGTDYVALYFRDEATKWFKSAFHEDDLMIAEPLWEDEEHFVGFRLYTEEGYQAQHSGVIEEGQNWHFTSVRPDWRDSKSLLGYYNPLTGSYEWTPFLQFLLHAVRSYRREERLPWFVILDEMNLAHVEYYFADLLSVLESGRDKKGWTREALQLVYPDDATGDLPPGEIHLPPNLYVVGTVNVDETTHAFSPKVQDRAFTLELTEADFSNYPPTGIDGDYALSRATRQALLEAFSNDGRFARIEKEMVAGHVADYPEVRRRLQRLNEQLRPHGFHFGYRVFDEIVAFLANAQDTGVYESVTDGEGRYDGLGEGDLAFDAAVLMKVLPKFHGSRAQLEEPLLKMLAWARDPDNPDDVSVEQDVTQVDLLSTLSCRLPHTAERLQRMLRSLYTIGFAT